MIYIVVPAYNEAQYLPLFLKSLVTQTVLPQKVVVVNDNSTDETSKIVQKYTAEFPWITLVENSSKSIHQPGSKVIKAFTKGLESLDTNFEVIIKLDADLILPEDYLEEIIAYLNKNPKTGIVGGFAYIQKNNAWVLENLTNKNHVRGAFKAYRKQCFEAIGGLQPAMGWDTLDELLANYNGFEVSTIETLKVKHLKPTGACYSKNTAQMQGLAFYQLGYGFWLTLIASLKLAFLKKKPLFFFSYLIGYWLASAQKKPMLVTAAQKEYIQNYRWMKMKQKFILRK
jgi:glycosyltransferase involved in cell wall biosynthesis